MTPDAASSPHSLATASGLLLGALGAAMAVGALVGWRSGWDIGLLVGALVGIPLGVLVVYLVYSREGRRERGHLLDAAPAPEPARADDRGRRLILLALPVFAVAGWPLGGWALAAVLWFAAHASRWCWRGSGRPR